MSPKSVRNTMIRNQPEKRLAAFAEARPSAASAATIETQSMTSVDISAAIRKRPLLAAAPFLLALLAGVPYALLNSRQEYRAEATVYVSPTYYKNLQSDREQLPVPYSTLLNQQILSLRRHDILKEALARLELRGIAWRAPGESEAGAIARLASKLDIRPIPDSYEVLIGLSGNKKEMLAPIVNTVADTYLEKDRSEELSDRSSRFSVLKATREKLEATLKQRLEQQSQISGSLKVTNPEKAQPADDTLLAGSRQALEDARRKRMEAEAHVQIMASTTPGSSRNVMTSIAEETVANDPSLRTMANYYTQRTVELRTRIEGLTPEHPLRQATEKEIASIKAQLEALPRGPLNEASTRMMTKLKADAARARLLETELEKQVAAGTSNVQAVARQVQEAQGLGEEIARLRNSLGSISTTIDGALQDGSPKTLRIFSAAQTPLAPSKTNQETMLAMFALLALISSVGLCVVVDQLDQRIFSPAEVKRAVGFMPVGLLVEQTPETEAFSEEHFWRLVNGIRRAIAVHDAKTIVFTPLRFSRNPETLVADIARALTSCGLKTAILETNPSHGAERGSTGLAEVVSNGEHGMQSSSSSLQTAPVIQSTALQSASSAAPARRGDSGPAAKALVRVSTVGREIVEKMKDEHDVVLIDAPSLLLSADIEFISVISDMTLIVVEAGDATRKELVQGFNILKRVGASSVGVVMSQVVLNKAGGDLNQEYKWFTRRHASESKIHADATTLDGR